MDLGHRDEGQQVSARRGIVVGAVGFATVAGMSRMASPSEGPAGIAQVSSADEALAWARESGIVDPEREGAVVSRADAVSSLFRLAGSPEFPPGSYSPFADVDASHPSSAPVLWARGRGIRLGGADSTFAPDTPVTRGEGCGALGTVTAAALARVRDPLFSGPQASIGRFADVPDDHPWADDIEWARSSGVLTPAVLGVEAASSGGVANAEFRPDAALVTEVWAHMLHSVAELLT